MFAKKGLRVEPLSRCYSEDMGLTFKREPVAAFPQRLVALKALQHSMGAGYLR
jgi:hypothetical protein